MYRRRMQLTMALLSVLFLAGSAGAQEADPNFVGWWTFDADSGTTVVDASGSGNDGTIMAGPAGELEYVSGFNGLSLRFPGDDQGWVELPPEIANTAQGTVAAWINTTQNDNEGMIWYGTETDGDGFGDQNELHLNTDDVGAGVVQLRLEGSPDRTLTSDEIGGTGWRHVAATWDLTDGLRLYVDGEEVASAEHNGNVVGFAIMRLGRPVGTGNGNRYYEGLMDEVRLYNRTLTAGEVADLAVRPKAWDPDPADGAEGVELSLLQWQPGSDAVFHKVYLGTDPNLGEDDVVAPMAGAPLYFHTPGLTPGVDYYWRVDEIQADQSVVEGDLWTFSTPPAQASQPSPADGTPFATLDAELTWQRGFGAATHDVYFGTDADAVATGTGDTFKANTPGLTYQPEMLEAATTYHWRVDEVASDGTKVAGEVWSFTTVPVIEIDDPDLLAWWKMDAGAGSTVVDWSGHDRHAIFADPAPAWALGWINGALEFTGNGDSAVYADGTFMNGLDAVTITAWIRSDVVDTDRGFLIFEPPAGNDDFDIRYDSAGATGGADDVLKAGLTVQTGADTTQIVQIESSPNSQTTGWQHVALVWASGEEMQLYLDGELDLLSALPAIASGTLTGFQTVILGKGGKDEGGTLSWDGLLDDVRIYGVALSEEQVQEAMRGDPLHAWAPSPADAVITDAWDATPLTWEPGITAVEHDVYLTADPNVIADVNASDTTGVYRGRQAGTSYTPDPALEWDQDYYWRIDEVDADGGIEPGRVWTFTLTDYITVDDFESYDDNQDAGTAIFQTWIDGFGDDTNGSQVGYIDSTNGTYGETATVYEGDQAMPLFFDNTSAPVSEATISFSPAQDWTRDDVTTLSLVMFEDSDNVGGDVYVEINSTEVPLVDEGTYPDGFNPGWVRYNIDLTALNVSNVRSLTVGVEGANAQGVLYIDEIRLYKEAPDVQVLTQVGPIIEAEDGDFNAPFEVFSNIPNASGGQYIMVPNGTGGSGDAPAEPNDGWAVYTIEVPADGDYVIALRGLRQVAGAGGDDSFWVRVPDAVLNATPFLPPDWIRCGGVFPGDNQDVMVWDLVEDWLGGGLPDTDPVIFTLTAGQHELQISRREDGTALDAITVLAVE